MGVGTMKKLENLVETRTDMEKIYDAFLRRYRKFWDDAGSGMREHDIEELWHEWLKETKKVEIVQKKSNRGQSVDYLLERVNEPGFNRVVIHDPGNANEFLIIDRDFAEKVLVLGDLP